MTILKSNDPAIQDSPNSRGAKTAAPPRVLITATVRWPNVALLAIGLKDAGNLVAAVCPGHHLLEKTPAVQSKFRYSSLRPLESLQTAIDSFRPQIVVPCDDRAVQHLHELHAKAICDGGTANKTAALIQNSLGMPGAYPTVISRHDFLKLARDQGLCVPNTERILTPNDLQSWRSRQSFPWVLKTDGTFSGRGVKIVYDWEQAQAAVRQLGRYYTGARALKRFCVNRDPFWFRPWWKGVKPPITVQAYVRGRPANCAVASWKGKVLSVIAVEVLAADGDTGPARVVRIVDSPVMMIAAERVAASLSLSGFFGLDFVIESGTGATHLIEINPRPTRPSSLQLGKGRDPVMALTSCISGQPCSERTAVTSKTTVSYFPDALACGPEILASTFQDAPEGEPELIAELLKPWPPQGMAWHLADCVYRLRRLFRDSTPRRKPVPEDNSSAQPVFGPPFNPAAESHRKAGR